MVKFIGLDVHKDTIHASVLNNKGEMLVEKKFLNTIEELDKFLEKLDPHSSLVMESCGMYEPVYDRIAEKGFSVTLAHPKKTKAIADAKIKTDSIASETLAQLLRADLIPSVYVPNKEIREIRTVVRHRASLVKLRSQVKHMIHGILLREGIKHEFSDLFGKAGIEWLKEVKLKDSNRAALNNYLGVLYIIDAKINMTNMHISSMVELNPKVKLLTSTPGIGPYSALLIAAEIADVDRFANAKKLCSYAGLVPSTYQSGNVTRHGNITKEGSKWLRWILIQCANKTVVSDPYLEKFYKRLVKKKGHNVAIVAVARKLLTYIYLMLKKEVDYYTLRSLAS